MREPQAPPLDEGDVAMADISNVLRAKHDCTTAQHLPARRMGLAH